MFYTILYLPLAVVYGTAIFGDLKRAPDAASITGVCCGLARISGLHPWLVRAIALVYLTLAPCTTLIVYILTYVASSD